jgi:hypothetical protein
MFGEFELENTLSPICEATVDLDEQGAFLLKQINVAAFINASLDSSLCPLIHHCCDVCLVVPIPTTIGGGVFVRSFVRSFIRSFVTHRCVECGGKLGAPNFLQTPVFIIYRQFFNQHFFQAAAKRGFQLVVTKSILVSRLGELADARTMEKIKSFEERFNINKTDRANLYFLTVESMGAFGKEANKLCG